MYNIRIQHIMYTCHKISIKKCYKNYIITLNFDKNYNHKCITHCITNKQTLQ